MLESLAKMSIGIDRPPGGAKNWSLASNGDASRHGLMLTVTVPVVSFLGGPASRTV